MKTDPFLPGTYIRQLKSLLTAIESTREAMLSSDELESIFWNVISVIKIEKDKQ